MELIKDLPSVFDGFAEQRKNSFLTVREYKEKGIPIVGSYCTYFPKEIAEEGVTMILVTHEIPFAREVASRVLFMDGGTIMEDGKPEDILDHPENERLRQFLSFVSRS